MKILGLECLKSQPLFHLEREIGKWRGHKVSRAQEREEREPKAKVMWR